MQKTPRVHDERHLKFVRQLPCVICRNDISTEACHIRFSCAAAGKLNPGVAAKPDDRHTLPMCGEHHREQHETGNERQFWKNYGINPLTTAAKLYEATGNYERGCEIVAQARVSVLIAG